MRRRLAWPAKAGQVRRPLLARHDSSTAQLQLDTRIAAHSDYFPAETRSSAGSVAGLKALGVPAGVITGKHVR